LRHAVTEPGPVRPEKVASARVLEKVGMCYEGHLPAASGRPAPGSSGSTAAMRRELLDGLIELWEAALDERRAPAPGFPGDGAGPSADGAREGGRGVSRQDRLPVVSQGASENEIRAGLPSGETGPDLLVCAVGVAGFEPTTSPSRIRSGSISIQAGWLSVLLRLWAAIGLRRSAKDLLSRSAPCSLPTHAPPAWPRLVGFPSRRSFGPGLVAFGARRASRPRPGIPEPPGSRAGWSWPPEARSGS
jgi:hypothetical protein